MSVRQRLCNDFVLFLAPRLHFRTSCSDFKRIVLTKPHVAIGCFCRVRQLKYLVMVRESLWSRLRWTLSASMGWDPGSPAWRWHGTPPSTIPPPPPRPNNLPDYIKGTPLPALALNTGIGWKNHLCVCVCACVCVCVCGIGQYGHNPSGYWAINSIWLCDVTPNIFIMSALLCHKPSHNGSIN